ALLSVSALLALVPSASAAGADNIRRVLVLYPVSDGQPGGFLFDQSLRSACQGESNQRIELSSEYLDAVRFPDDRYQRQLAEFLRQKYAGRRIDVVIPALAPSLDFVLKYREVFAPGVPVVFGAIEQREVAARDLGPGVVGIPMKVELVANLE